MQRLAMIVFIILLAIIAFLVFRHVAQNFNPGTILPTAPPTR